MTYTFLPFSSIFLHFPPWGQMKDIIEMLKCVFFKVKKIVRYSFCLAIKYQILISLSTFFEMRRWTYTFGVIEYHTSHNKKQRIFLHIFKSFWKQKRFLDSINQFLQLSCKSHLTLTHHHPWNTKQYH